MLSKRWRFDELCYGVEADTIVRSWYAISFLSHRLARVTALPVMRTMVFESMTLRDSRYPVECVNFFPFVEIRVVPQCSAKAGHG